MSLTQPYQKLTTVATMGTLASLHLPTSGPNSLRAIVADIAGSDPSSTLVEEVLAVLDKIRGLPIPADDDLRSWANVAEAVWSLVKSIVPHGTTPGHDALLHAVAHHKDAYAVLGAMARQATQDKKIECTKERIVAAAEGVPGGAGDFGAIDPGTIAALIQLIMQIIAFIQSLRPKPPAPVPVPSV
jgi:hypothetical protein